MAEYFLSSPEETRRFGAALGACLRPGDVVFLQGDLGSGKSVLTRAAAAALGVKDKMPSPTFTLMQPYSGRENVYHFDMYRLTDVDEYYAAGLDEYIGTDGIAFIEWPVAGIFAPNRIVIRFERGDGEEQRRVFTELYGMNGREDAIRRALLEWERSA